MIIVGFYNNNVIYENDGAFLINGEFLELSDIIVSCKAFKDKIYTDYGNDYSFCKMLTLYAESMIQDNEKILIIKDASYISQGIRFNNNTFVFYNDEKDIVFKELTFDNVKDRIAENLRIFDIKLQEKIDQYRLALTLPGCDEQYAKEIVLNFLQDEYDGYWDHDTVLREYTETKEGWEEFIKNKIVRLYQLLDILQKSQNYAWEWVIDVFDDIAREHDWYDEHNLKNDYVWNTKMNDIICLWCEGIKPNIK